MTFFFFLILNFWIGETAQRLKALAALSQSMFLAHLIVSWSGRDEHFLAEFLQLRMTTSHSKSSSETEGLGGRGTEVLKWLTSRLDYLVRHQTLVSEKVPAYFSFGFWPIFQACFPHRLKMVVNNSRLKSSDPSNASRNLQTLSFPFQCLKIREI